MINFLKYYSILLSVIHATSEVDTSNKTNLSCYNLEVLPICHVGSLANEPGIWEIKGSNGLDLCPQSARLMHFKTAVFQYQLV